jgi:TonB family protein
MIAQRIRAFAAWIAILIVASVAAHSAAAEPLPEMRPALIGSRRDALINLIDTQKLIKAGQGDAAVLFRCFIREDGQASSFSFSSVTPGGEKFRDEVRRCLYSASFIPAVFHHKIVPAIFFGAATFRVVGGTPRLRAFANQERAELEKESDFISPQIIFLPGEYSYFTDPRGSWASEQIPGAAEMLLSVDASGHLQNVQVIKETPSGHKFGETALKALNKARYLPAFRNGKPVDSTTHTTYLFSPR